MDLPLTLPHRFRCACALIGILIMVAATPACHKKKSNLLLLPPSAAASPMAETVCHHLATPGGGCELSGSGTGLLIQGDILTSSGVLRGGEVLVAADGTINCAACDCPTTDARVLTCPNSVVSPSLINSSEHITFNQNVAITDIGERYEHRHEWRTGRNGHTKITAPAGASTAAAILYLELGELLTGTTSTVSAGGTPGLLRNIDQAANQEGLPAAKIINKTFPLNDSTPPVGNYTDCAIDYTGISVPPLDAVRWMIEVGESISYAGEYEVLCLTGRQVNAVDRRGAGTVWVGMAALNGSDFAALPGAKAVWMPRSDISTYGDTVRITQAVRQGWQMSLGTYWTPTGSHDILRELQCADSFNRSYAGQPLSDLDLWKMVTENAADNMGYADQIGSLQAGRVADIAIFRGGIHRSYRSIIEGSAADVEFVFRGGKLLYGLPGIPEALGNPSNCDTITVCGENRSLCARDELGAATYNDFLSSVPVGMPPLVLCPGSGFAERTCTPKRSVSVNSSSTYSGAVTATDHDGDGIPDTIDNCPSVFNPIRPMDNGVQEDSDANGIGDACER